MASSQSNVCDFWATTLGIVKHFRFSLLPVRSYGMRGIPVYPRSIVICKRFQIHRRRQPCNAKFTEISEGACNNPFDNSLFVLVRSFRTLESDQVDQISFGLCHVFREEGHQRVKQLQQRTYDNEINDNI